MSVQQFDLSHSRRSLFRCFRLYGWTLHASTQTLRSVVEHTETISMTKIDLVSFVSFFFSEEKLSRVSNENWTDSGYDRFHTEWRICHASRLYVYWGRNSQIQFSLSRVNCDCVVDVTTHNIRCSICFLFISMCVLFSNFVVVFFLFGSSSSSIYSYIST